MRFLDWLRPGIGIKRWFLLGCVGVASLSYGIAFFISELSLNWVIRLFAVFVMLCGIICIIISIRYFLITFFHAITNSNFKISLDSGKLSNMLYERRILINGPKIVTLGGGTGLSTMLRGLKLYSTNITAVVTVADDGGGSGVLRQDLGILPPGDIRNCVLALADTEPVMEKLLQYRFEEGMLKGQSFGNLFLAAMNGISDSFEEAVRKMSHVLAVTGKVLPVTLENIKLCAELEDHFVICGETNISKHRDTHKGRIKRVYLEPQNAKPLMDVLESIREADVIVLGPGSLYTSIIPNLLIEGVCDEIKQSNAIVVYVCNVMTQPGETDDYSVLDHVNAIEEHTYKGFIDYCIVNVDDIPEELEKKYLQDGAQMVKQDKSELHKAGIRVIEGNFLSVNRNLIRHNADKLAHTVVKLVTDTVISRDKRRIMEYYYIMERLKNNEEMRIMDIQNKKKINF